MNRIYLPGYLNPIRPGHLEIQQDKVNRSLRQRKGLLHRSRLRLRSLYPGWSPGTNARPAGTRDGHQQLTT